MRSIIARIERLLARAIIQLALRLPRPAGDSRELHAERVMHELAKRIAMLGSAADRESVIVNAEVFERALRLAPGTIRRRFSTEVLNG